MKDKKMYSSRSFDSRQKGQDLFEFALVLPLLLLVLVGVFDLGRAFYTSIVITNVAREGARFGALNRDKISGVLPTTCTEPFSDLDEIIEAACIEAGNYGLEITQLTITPSCPDGCAAFEELVISVSYDFDLLLSGLFSFTDFTLVRSAKMMIQ